MSNLRLAFFNRRSIRYPLARLIAASVLVAIGLSLAFFAALMLDTVRTDIRRNLTNAANAAGSAASAAIVFHDSKVAWRVLRMFEAYPEIEAAALYSGEGPRLASYGRDVLLPQDARAIAPPSLDIEPLADTYILMLPVELDATPIGTVYLRARLHTYWQTYLTSIATAILIALSAGALSLFLAMRFLNRIIQPVRLLAEAANDARIRKDFEPREIPAVDDEIGDLVRNFNALLAEVEASRKSLQSQQEHLEHLVEERTAELLAAKESADAANTAKSRFLAAASHDLRQPIHAMRLFLDTLNSTPLNDEQRRTANYLTLSARSLADILNSLLDVSRLDGGIVRPQNEVVPAYALLHKIEAEFAPLALAKGLRFQFYFPGRELMLFTDTNLLYSLLRNLIDNAIKYTERGGVLVGFRRHQGSALIQVWDTGIGINQEQIDAIFVEYFQVGNPQRDRTKGLGLGLSIARRVAGILGCNINCRSRPGRGSRFEVSIPLADAQEQRLQVVAGKASEHATMGSTLAALHVAVIDDDAMVIKALELLLGTHRMRTSTYLSAEKALADPDIGTADFYVVDYRLPGMNGLQFLDEIEKRVTHPICATLLTGETSSGAIASDQPLRWKVMFKPIGAEALLAEIRSQTGASVTRRHPTDTNA